MPQALKMTARISKPRAVAQISNLILLGEPNMIFQGQEIKSRLNT